MPLPAPMRPLVPPAQPAQVIDIWFPLFGTDISTALERQTPDTTPMGVNVQGYEPQTMRARGGSREGLSKFIDQVLPISGPGTEIQMLQIVVDPQALALGISFDDTLNPPPQIIDDSNDGRNLLGDGAPGQVFVGGSGFHTPRQYNRNIPILIVTADDEVKAEGTTFTWAGNEFTDSGPQVGDVVNAVSFASDGADPSASPGNYPIVPSDLTWTTLTQLVASLTINNSGSLYFGPPQTTITFSGGSPVGGGSLPVAFPVVNGGMITGTNLKSRGSGLTTAPNVTINDPTKVVSGVAVGAGGSNFSSDTTIKFTGGTLVSGGSLPVAEPVIVSGVITAVKMLYVGRGLTTTPSVAAHDSVGGGATLTAVMTAAGGANIAPVMIPRPYNIVYQNGTLTVNSSAGLGITLVATNGNWSPVPLAYSPVSAGDFIVVMEMQSQVGGLASVAVTDDLGNSYTQLQAASETGLVFDETNPSTKASVELSIWVCVSVASGSPTISAGNAQSNLLVANFSGVATGASTTLDGAINSTVTSLTVASASGFPTGVFRIFIDSETMLVTNVSGTTFTVTRGALGTTAASHVDTSAITSVAGPVDHSSINSATNIPGDGLPHDWTTGSITVGHDADAVLGVMVNYQFPGIIDSRPWLYWNHGFYGVYLTDTNGTLTGTIGTFAPDPFPTPPPVWASNDAWVAGGLSFIQA